MLYNIKAIITNFLDLLNRAFAGSSFPHQPSMYKNLHHMDGHGNTGRIGWSWPKERGGSTARKDLAFTFPG
jgi:hypothetical protein